MTLLYVGQDLEGFLILLTVPYILLLESTEQMEEGWDKWLGKEQGPQHTHHGRDSAVFFFSPCGNQQDISRNVVLRCCVFPFVRMGVRDTI